MSACFFRYKRPSTRIRIRCGQIKRSRPEKPPGTTAGRSRYSRIHPVKTKGSQRRYPCLSIHGIEGAFSGTGGKTVVPGKVTGKVSMRLVPDQDPEEITQIFTEYVQAEFEKLRSPNQLTIVPLGSGEWWLGDINNFLFHAGKAALETYWKIEPSFAVYT